MSLPLIYIAGPFRGPTPLAVRRNVEAARDLGLRVAEAGGYPVIPHTMTSEFDKLITDEFWLQGTMELLRRCDGIVLHPNWVVSRGAKAEYDWAQEHHMPTLIVDLTVDEHVVALVLWRFVGHVRENMQSIEANLNRV